MLLELRRLLRRKKSFGHRSSYFSGIGLTTNTVTNAVYVVKRCASPAYHVRYLYRLFISRLQIAKLESEVADVIERYRYDPFRN